MFSILMFKFLNLIGMLEWSCWELLTKLEVPEKVQNWGEVDVNSVLIMLILGLL